MVILFYLICSLGLTALPAKSQQSINFVLYPSQIVSSRESLGQPPRQDTPQHTCETRKGGEPF